MTIEKKLLGTTPVSGAVDPEAVSFDGSNDYLSRSSDLSGNADGKTFTFSAWVYVGDYSDDMMIYSAQSSGGTNGFLVKIISSGEIKITGYNTSGSEKFAVSGGNAGKVPLNTFTHILLSVDVTNTSNRYLYIDDVLQSPIWDTYINENINFTLSGHNVGRRVEATDRRMDGRLAHVFLDYTYRDLSVEANRRLFIDSDGKPASGQASLNPILYLPMTDAATAGSNSGTGGDFTVNGVLDTAGRAPNQFNCSASVFDGSADKLNIASMGASNGKLGTLSLVFKAIDTDNNSLMIDGTYGMQVEHLGASDSLQIRWYTDAGGNGIAVLIADIPLNASHHVSISFDTANSSNRKAVLNGVLQADSVWTTYIADALVDFNTDVDIGSDGASYFNNVIGEVYMDNAYTDLATDNPFWDSDANRPKPVRQVISETGTTPLIALPLRGDDAGNNLGSGGDFTVNSGPYTGARGGSEFWARSAKFDGSTGAISRTALIGATTSQKFTLVASVDNFSGISDTSRVIVIGEQIDSTTYIVLTITFNSPNWNIGIKANHPNGVDVLYSSSQLLSATKSNLILISIDTGNSLKNFFLNEVDKSSTVTISTSNNVVDTANTDCSIGRRSDGYQYMDGDIGFLYFNDTYIDFSQESNRNLFVDQLGYPKDLTPAIDAGDIAEPLIYMKFDDTSALGTNSGTGGDFTVNGTVTAGADVDPNA